jgi:hypothetical protein
MRDSRRFGSGGDCPRDYSPVSDSGGRERWWARVLSIFVRVFRPSLLMVVNSELPLAKSASVLRSPRSSSSKSGKTLFHISRIRLQSLPTRPINPAPLSAKVMCLDPIFTGQTVNRVTPDKVHQTNSNQSKIRFLLLARTSSPLFILLAGSICGIYFA